MKLWRGSMALLSAMAVIMVFAIPVSAHELAADNGITAELHIPPLDEPVAGQATRLQFTFENPPVSFSLTDCGCQVRATSSAKTAVTGSVRPDTTEKDRLLGSITFPGAGDYTVTLSGLTAGDHSSSFQLAYPVHVKPGPVAPGKHDKAAASVLMILCALAAIGVTWYYYRPKQKPGRSS